MTELDELIPLLITRGAILFPGCSITLDVGRVFSKKAVDIALNKNNGKIALVSQIDPNEDSLSEDSIYNVGTLCNIVSIRDTKGIYKIKIQCLSRISIFNINFNKEDEEESYYCDFKVLETIASGTREEEQVIVDEIINILQSFGPNNLPPSFINKLSKGITAEELVDQLAFQFPLPLQDKQKLLEELDIMKRLQYICSILQDIKGYDEVEKSINKRVSDRTSKQQREYLLREKLRATQDELNELTGDNEESEEESIMKKMEKESFPERIKKAVKKSLSKFKQLPSASLESSMEKTYLDTLMDMPWTRKTEDNDDLENVIRVLDEDHYGLTKVKERIVEYIAVKKVTNSLKSPIICLYGPPGVGKTSLAKSVARALGRKFAKASLGGLYDEAELRGHRRTYVGAMPGKIIKGIKNAGVNNPVFLLDEIDKMASSNKGDPSSALLEILDPEQNSVFQDNYLEETFDLSNVLFICTANYIQNVPGPLRDRLEMIELNSYTDIEKMNIAKNHLINKQCIANGLKLDQVVFEDEAIEFVIDFYTREAGVRELERLISSLCRKSVVELLRNPKIEKVIIDKKKVESYLGPVKFEYSKKEKDNQVGVVTGLAYTEFGGDILPIEVNYFEGNNALVLTGNLGNVMKESASIALDYVKANAVKYGIEPSFFEKHTIHIHVPEGAVPKDGPSAGVALTTCIISSLTNRKVKATVAMTGEVNLRGQSLPIGGLKEKSLAALRSGIKTIIIPRGNKKDIIELPEEVRKKLKIVIMDNVDDALKVAFIEE
ncbi:MAG: endopeptidase La [Bacillales bacterium]|nr:endopeptidase La [Bacillales bacterium]